MAEPMAPGSTRRSSRKRPAAAAEPARPPKVYLLDDAEEDEDGPIVVLERTDDEDAGPVVEEPHDNPHQEGEQEQQGAEPQEDEEEQEDDDDDDDDDDDEEEEEPDEEEEQEDDDEEPEDQEEDEEAQQHQLWQQGLGDDDYDGWEDDYPTDVQPAVAYGAVPERQPSDRELAPGVWARDQADGRHCLLGTALSRCPKLLERMFKMQQQHPQLLWRSQLSLTPDEWRYIQDALAADRIQPLLQRGERVLKPLSSDFYPARLRPTDSSGRPLSGPRISGPKSKPWNVGRQYFSSFKQGDQSTFIWADGVRAYEAEAVQSSGPYMAGCCVF